VVGIAFGAFFALLVAVAIGTAIFGDAKTTSSTANTPARETPTVTVTKAAAAPKPQPAPPKADPTSTPSVSDTPLNDAFNANRQTTTKMCTLYYSLVNQGWTDDQIYKQLADGGAFDGYVGGSGSTMFHSLIKWCYAN
jgi:hypothetical protein